MAAPSDFSGKQLLTDIDDKVLLCAICMERFKSPKILPCYHTFCEPCLTEWVKRKNGQLVCPTCKKLCPLPSEGVRALDRNRFLDDLLGVIGDVRPDKNDMAVCVLCEKEAKHWCGDCGGHFFCNNCIQNHSKLTVLKDHTPMKIEEYTKKMSTQHFRITKPRFCDTHSRNKLEFFCDTCQVPTCYKCTVVEHATTAHRIISLESTLEKYMPEMKARSEKVAQRITNLKVRMNRVNDVRKKLDANRSTADVQIKALSQKLIDAITNLEINLHSEVDGIYNQKRKQIDAEVELLQDQIASAESIHSHLNHLLTFGGALDIVLAQTQIKNGQENYDDLTNALCGDVDSTLVFTENPDCLKMNLGVVKGLCPSGRKKTFAEGDIAEPVHVLEDIAQDSQRKCKVYTEPNEPIEDYADFDHVKKALDKSEESAEDKVMKSDDEIANDNKVILGQVEPMKKTDKINEPKEIVITREPRLATTELTDISALVRQREVDEGQESGNGDKPLVVSDKKDYGLDVPDHNVSTETALETGRKTHKTERDGSTITDDIISEKHNDVGKVIDEQTFEQKRKSDAEKLREVGEDHDVSDDYSAAKDMDKIDETRGKDDRMITSDSKREKSYDVATEIEAITTENSSADTGEESQKLKIALNREDQGTSRRTDEAGAIVIKNAEIEQGRRSEVHSKDDDEEQRDKTDKNKSETPHEGNSLNVPHSSQDTVVYNLLFENDDSSKSCNESDNKKVDPIKPQDSDNKDNSHNDPATTTNFQRGDFHTGDESDASSTDSTDSNDSAEAVPTTYYSWWQRWWPNTYTKGNKPLLRTESSCEDTSEYRSGYPGKEDDNTLMKNMLFYKNAIESEPRGDLIDNIHEYWWGDYDKLERHQGYIEWVFPIREMGMNYKAQELQLHEAEEIKCDKKAWARVLKSYEMMLDFYGMKLVDKEKGTIERAKNWKERYGHLNRSTDNYLRITRILKSLGELGYEHLKTPFVEFVLTEALEKGELENCLDSCVQYWVDTIKSSKDRKLLKSYFDSHYDFS